MYKYLKYGFSLVELLVVITIVGVVAVIAIPSYNNYMSKARMAAAMQPNYAMQKMADTYFGKYGTWPDISITGADFTSMTPYANISPHLLSLGWSGVTLGSCSGGYVVPYMYNVDGHGWNTSLEYFLPVVFMYSIEKNNVIYHKCYYTDYSGIDPIRTSSDLVQDCEFTPITTWPGDLAEDYAINELGC